MSIKGSYIRPIHYPDGAVTVFNTIDKPYI